MDDKSEIFYSGEGDSMEDHDQFGVTDSSDKDDEPKVKSVVVIPPHSTAGDRRSPSMYAEFRQNRTQERALQVPEDTEESTKLRRSRLRQGTPFEGESVHREEASASSQRDESPSLRRGAQDRMPQRRGEKEMRLVEERETRRESPVRFHRDDHPDKRNSPEMRFYSERGHRYYPQEERTGVSERKSPFHSQPFESMSQERMENSLGDRDVRSRVYENGRERRGVSPRGREEYYHDDQVRDRRMERSQYRHGEESLYPQDRREFGDRVEYRRRDTTPSRRERESYRREASPSRMWQRDRSQGRPVHFSDWNQARSEPSNRDFELRVNHHRVGRRPEIERSHNHSHVNVKAREFTGVGSWREYRGHFERVCRLNGWWEFRLDYLWVHLASNALTYAESLPESRTSTYESLCESLERRFGDERLAEVYKAELRTRQRLEGESIPALGQDIRHLVQYAYPGIGMDGVEELSIEKFKDSLTNADQRMSVHQAHPRSLEEAIQVAMDMEAWQMSERRRGQNERMMRVRAVKDESGTTVEKVLEKIEHMIQAWTEKGSQQPKERDDRDRKRDWKCFRCGKPGHVARNCFSYMRDEAAKEKNRNERESERKSEN